MKNLYLAVMIIFLTFSCNQKKKGNSEIIIDETIDETTDEAIDDLVLEAFEKEIEEIAIGGDGIIFENGKMTFDIETLESTLKQAEDQMNDIKESDSHESESIKQNAIESMELNLNMFRGEFCCTTHDGEHCEDSKKLRKLQKNNQCQRFMKKE